MQYQYSDRCITEQEVPGTDCQYRAIAAAQSLVVVVICMLHDYIWWWWWWDTGISCCWLLTCLLFISFSTVNASQKGVLNPLSRINGLHVLWCVPRLSCLDIAAYTARGVMVLVMLLLWLYLRRWSHTVDVGPTSIRHCVRACVIYGRLYSNRGFLAGVEANFINPSKNDYSVDHDCVSFQMIFPFFSAVNFCLFYALRITYFI